VGTLSLVLFGLLGLHLVVRDFRERKKSAQVHPYGQEFERAALRLFVIVMFSRAVAGYVLGSFVFVRYVTADVIPRLPAPSAAVVGIAVTAVLGALLFLIRLKARSVYAVLEIGTALALAAIQAPKFRADDPWDLGFLLTFVPATIYLFVRGCDNMHAALTKEPDLFIQLLVEGTRAVHGLLRRSSKKRS
jgi:hypothetical protein